MVMVLTPKNFNLPYHHKPLIKGQVTYNIQAEQVTPNFLLTLKITWWY